jgi:hypothetical protein
MAREQVNEDKLSVYIAKPKRGQGLLVRLRKIGVKQDRSVNYLVVEAIREYVERHEKEA